MSDIFDPNLEPTREEQIKRLVSSIYETNAIAREAIIGAVKHAMNTIWRHPEFRPQEFLDVIGERGYSLFKAAVVYQNALAATVPGYEKIEIDEEYVINPDGSVTHIIDSSSYSSEEFSSESSEEYSSESSFEFSNESSELSSESSE